jgi:hypothetical protein
MWELWHLTTLWAFMACYMESFTYYCHIRAFSTFRLLLATMLSSTLCKHTKLNWIELNYIITVVTGWITEVPFPTAGCTCHHIQTYSRSNLTAYPMGSGVHFQGARKLTSHLQLVPTLIMRGNSTFSSPYFLVASSFIKDTNRCTQIIIIISIIFKRSFDFRLWNSTSQRVEVSPSK